MRYLLIIPLITLLAACSKQEPATGEAAPAPAAVAEAPAPAAVEALPGGVEFDIPSQLRSDKTYKTKAGATRRKVVYELLEAAPGQAEAVVTTTLAKAGYTAGAPKPGKKGQYSIRYKKTKAPSITATFYPKLAKKPANPAAKSMVAFSWQTKKAPKPKNPAG